MKLKINKEPFESAFKNPFNAAEFTKIFVGDGNNQVIIPMNTGKPCYNYWWWKAIRH